MSSEKSEGPKKFSLRRNEVEIELEMEDGSIGKYIIREMSGAQRDIYLKLAVSKANFDSEGKLTKVTDPTGLQPALISMCMVDATNNNYVDVKFANGLRTTVQNDIFELCSEINGLDKEADDKSKKG